MRRLYKYISLVAAKLVGRRHERDIEPPGMKELENAFVSRSDNAITARPDFNVISEDVLAVSSSIDFDATDNTDDYLNSASGIYGSDNTIWFSKIAPLTVNAGESLIACSSYSTGTVSITNGEVRVDGTTTEFLQNSWAGGLIEFDENGIYYKIAGVVSDTALDITEELQEATHTDVAYRIYQNHQIDHADYKLNLQPYTSGMLYSCPTITTPVDSNKICGPFYASTVETNTTDEWTEFTDDDDMGIILTDNSTSSMSLATTNSGFMGIYRSNNSPYRAILTSSDPETNWEEVSSYPADIDFQSAGVGVGASENSSYYYLAGRRSASPYEHCVMSTLDGSSWTVYEHPTDTGRNSIGVITGPSSGRRVALFSDRAYYSDNNFGTWNDSLTGLSFVRFGIYAQNNYVIVESTGAHYSSSAADGSWTECRIYDAAQLNSIAYGNGVWLAPDGNTNRVYRANSLSFTFSPIYLSAGGTDYTGPANIVWAEDKFFFSAYNTDELKFAILSTSDGVSFNEEILFSSSSMIPIGSAYSTVSKKCVFLLTNGSSQYLQAVVSGQTRTETSWVPAVFSPISDEHRSLSHSVLDGYVVLFGVRDYDSDISSWEYHPRRIRWTVPLTYNDFSSSGSGSAELDGSGALLDSRAVNGRIVVFESTAIGALSPRGYATDPWEYDRIKDNIRSISNPVVVDDMCYFIDDSGLLRSTNGMSVESPPFSFDLTEYDDFNSDSPIWLTYAPELEALAIYNPNSSDRHVYCVEPESGAVTRMRAAAVDGGDPKSLVCVENSSDRRMMINFNPISTDTDTLVISALSTGETITGIDEWTLAAGDDTYHVTDIETPQVFIVQEGTKTGIKHIIANTYTDGTSLATNPILVVQCKSLEDDEWHDNGDTNGTITVTDAACTGVGTAWSNTIGASGSEVYTLPCLATQARVYVGSTLQVLDTDYTITDTREITFGSSTTDTVYAYWENEPTPVVGVGDMIQTTEGWHRITAVNTATSLSLDHYMPALGNDATATHHFGTAIPPGDGETKIGISKLVEGAKLRFLIIHRSDGDATVTKITGFSIGHVPAGEKIVEP